MATSLVTTTVVLLMVAAGTCRAYNDDRFYKDDRAYEDDRVYNRNMTSVEFLEHVLMHEKQWSLVLRQRVKRLDPPPYQDRFPNALVDDYATTEVFDTHDIVTRVMLGYADIKSFADYGANAVVASLTCFTVKNLSFQSYYVRRLVDSPEAGTGEALAALDKLRNNVVVYLDKLAAGRPDLELSFQLFWEVVRLVQFDMIDRVRDNAYPSGSGAELEKLNRSFHEYAEKHCECEKPAQWFRNIGLEADPLVVDLGVFKLSADLRRLKELGARHAAWTTVYYSNLGIETMPRRLWKQIFYYSHRGRVIDRPDDRMDSINAPIAPLPPPPPVQPHSE